MTKNAARCARGSRRRDPAPRQPHRLGARGVWRSRGLWLAVLLLIAWPGVQAERLPLRIYTTADGLAHNAVHRIVRDSRGFLWFCTAEGLSRFDGYLFANFGADQGLPHAPVYDLLETRAGEYWLATGAGLVRFDPNGLPRRSVGHEKDRAAAAVMFTVTVPDDDHRRARTITVLRESADGTIWVGTRRGLYRVDRSSGQTELRLVAVGMSDDSVAERDVVDLIEDAHGSLWVATEDGLFRRWPDGRAARYGTSDGLTDSLLSDLMLDHDGRLWVGTRAGGFFRMRTDEGGGASAVELTLRTKDGLPHEWVTQLFEDADRRFWAGTAHGLAEFFPAASADERRFRTHTRQSGLIWDFVAGLTEDVAGNLWLSSESGGAMKLTRGGFTTFGEADGVEFVGAMFADRLGNLCVKGVAPGNRLTPALEGSHIRFGCLDGRQFRWFAPAALTDKWGWVLEEVTLQARNGEWWVGAGEGLFRFGSMDRFADIETARPVAFYGSNEGLTARQVFRLFEDSRSNIWVSTISSLTNGLALIDPNGDGVRDLAGAPGLPAVEDDLARSFGEDGSGRIWIGFNGGLARYTDGRFQFFTARDGLPAGPIMNIYQDRADRLWLASAQGGLVRVDDGGADRPAFVVYTVANGLSSDNVEVITEGHDGLLYLGGGHGLDRFDPATGRVQHFTAADGLPTGIVKTGFLDRDGVLWFGTTGGLAQLAPAPEKPPAPPLMLISGLRVAGVPQAISALGDREVFLPDLAPDRNQLQVDFVALGFGSGEVLRYQYRLQAADTDWSPLSETRTVTYASLSPGRYAFQVRAVNSAGTASAAPASIRFRILRPVWQRWWFISIVARALGLVARGAYRHRVARLVELANMRARIATDLHDDIGANLTRIALLSEVARQTHDDGPLTSVARIARESVSAMSDIVWAINPKRESLLDLIRRMRQHAEEIFALRDIELGFDAPDETAGVRLGMDVRRDVLLVFKEAVSNAACHSGCSRVSIQLRVDGARLVLVVADNGAGFDTSHDSDGQGLGSMTRRAERLEGTLDIVSGPGVGTTITLAVPM